MSPEVTNQVQLLSVTVTYVSLRSSESGPNLNFPMKDHGSLSTASLILLGSDDSANFPNIRREISSKY